MKQKPNLVLFLLILSALVVRVTFWRLSPNLVWPDEIFLSMEQAHRLVFGEGVVPKDYWMGLRSWLLPGLLAGVMALTSWVSEGSTGYLLGCSIALSAFSLAPVFLVWRSTRSFGSRYATLLACFVLSFHFELLFFSSKALPEVLAVHSLMWGLFFFETPSRTIRSWLTLGFFVGLSLAFRIHLLPAIAIFSIFVLWQGQRNSRWAYVWGFLLPIVFVGILDWITWSIPFISYVRYLKEAFSSGGYATLLSVPWWLYFQWLWQVWSWNLLLLLALFFFGAYKEPKLGIFAVIAFSAHSFISHKEYRFIYPALVSFHVLSAVSLAWALAWFERQKFSALWHRLTFACVPFLFLLLMLNLSSNYRGLSVGDVFHPAQKLMWKRYKGVLRAFEQLSTDPKVCGVGLVGIGWSMSGGYTYLHKKIPLFDLSTHRLFQKHQNQFNVLLVREESKREHASFSVVKCWDTVCMYRREGACNRDKKYHINDILFIRGQ